MKSLTHDCAEPGCLIPRLNSSRYCAEHKQLHRNEIRPCANPGCKSSALNNSSYCSKECRDKAYYNKSRGAQSVKCAEPGCDAFRHAAGKYCLKHCKHTAHQSKAQKAQREKTKEGLIGVHRPHRGVLIADPLCANPYWISKTEWNENAAEYIALGCEAVMGDKQEVMI